MIFYAESVILLFEFIIFMLNLKKFIMKNSSNNRIALSSAALVLYLVSLFLGGVAEIAVLSVATVVVTAVLVMAIKSENCLTNTSVWHAMCFCLVVASLLGCFGLSLLSALCGLLAFGLMVVIVFKAVYFLNTVCHRHIDDELGKEE